MKLQDTYRDDFLLAKSENRIPNYRFLHGKQIYETACIECLERLQKLNLDRLNYMLQKENVCAYILVLGLNKYMKYKDFFEFLSYVYDDRKENSIAGEKNLEIIIKLLISGYENLVLQKQINLNVEQLQESDEIILMKYYEQVQNEQNPIGRMQELVSKHIKENIILGFNDDEILDLSFIGQFHLTYEGANLISMKKKRKTRLFLLALPFVLFYIHEQRIFNIDATYSPFIRYSKQMQLLKGDQYKRTFNMSDGYIEEERDSSLYEISDQDEYKLKIIKQKMEKSPLFYDLEAKTSNQINILKSQVVSSKGKKKTMQTPAMGGVSTVNQQQAHGNNSQLICGNTGKAPAFINVLHKDHQIREPSQAAGILPVQQKDLAEKKVIEALVHANDADKKQSSHEFIQNIMKEPYDSLQDENLLKENDNPKGLLLEIAMKHMKTHSCLQFKCTQMKAKEFECVLIFSDNIFYTRGRSINKKESEKIAAAKMLPLLQEYVQEKEQQLSKPKKLFLFSTHTNQTLRMTDKVNNDLKNHHSQLQKTLENNLYHPNSSSQTQGQGNQSQEFNNRSTSYNNINRNSDNQRKNGYNHKLKKHNSSQQQQNQQNRAQRFDLQMNSITFMDQNINYQQNQIKQNISLNYQMGYNVQTQIAQPQQNPLNFQRNLANKGIQQEENIKSSTNLQNLTLLKADEKK